jgi:glycogen synthase
MQIVQLGPYPPPYGGVQANIVAIREYLRRDGIDSAVINLTRHHRDGKDGVFYPRTAGQTAALLTRLPARIIHLHIGGSVSLRLAALGIFCALIPRRRTVLTFHSGGYPSSNEGRRASRFSIRGFAFRRFDRVIVVNSELVDVFRRYGVCRERVRVIAPHAVEMNEIADIFSKPFSDFFACHHPVLLSVGLLEPEYDLGLQIDVLESIRERHPGAGLVIIGSGSLQDQLTAKILSKSYRQHILLAGDVAHPQTLRVIQECDALLRTTLYDGDAVSVREALFLGTPVVATDNGMRPPGLTLIPAGDAAALEAAVEQVLSKDQPRDVRRELSGRENMEAVISLYRELGLKPASSIPAK